MAVATQTGGDVWIKFIKDYNDGEKDFKKDGIVKLTKDIGDSLINLKIAEITKAPDEDISDKITKELTETLTAQMEAGISKALENITESFKKKNKIPAVPIDHDIEKMRGFKDTGEFIVKVIEAGKPGAVPDARLLKAPSGQSTVDDVEGGFLVLEDMEKTIWEFIVKENEILGLTDQRFTSGQSLKINRVPQTSRKSGYRHGGAIAYWMAEADQFTASILKWGRMRLELHKLGCLFYCTDEELDDAYVALGPVFNRRAAQAINFLVTESFFFGTGAGQPQGIMNSDALIVVPIEANQDCNTPILHKNVNKMYHRLHPQLLRGARWYIHPNLLEKVEYISFNDDAVNQRPIYMPPGGLSASPYGTLKGLPVVPCEFCKDVCEIGDIVLANWDDYVTLQKRGGGIKSATSIHVRFLFEEQAFRFSYRIDGQSMWSSPLEDLNGTTTRSPYITLGNRATGGSSSGL